MVIDPISPSKGINRRLLLSLHQDGLFDILAGLIIITFGLIPILDETGMGVGLRQIIYLSLYGFEVFMVLWLKRRITLPRSGLVVLSRKKSRLMSLIFLIVNVLVFIFFAGSYAFDLNIGKLFGQFQLAIPLGLLFLIMLTVSGALFQAPRYYAYAILVFASFVFFEHLFIKGQVVHHGIPAAAMISGGIIVLSGVLLLNSFLRRYKIED